MSDEVLTTKFFRPPPRENRVHRPRLMERMKEGLGGKVTLVSAPAGFGKTSLVSEWAGLCGMPVAWISLDEQDSDPSRFLSLMIESLVRNVSELNEDSLDLFRDSYAPAADTALKILLNELSSVTDDFIVVLDDFHSLDSTAVDRMLDALIKGMPRQMHLIIMTREDPDIPLAGLRARGELHELRIADIRFSSSETTEYLNGAMSLGLKIEDIMALEKRTDGWITGLQLAALSLTGKDDNHDFIRTFAGDNRFVADYLMEEVLSRQDEATRDFLLRTSVCDRFCAPLCNCITGNSSSQPMLENLEKGNLFIIPLDERRQWYRYHHLFAELLRDALTNQHPDLVPEIHTNAANWFDSNNHPGEAIKHTLYSGRPKEAADIAQRIWPDWEDGIRAITWLQWAQLIPDDLVQSRPMLNISFIWGYLNKGDLEAAALRLDEIKEQVDSYTGEPGEQVLIEDFHELNASLNMARAYHTLALGDLVQARRYVDKALEILPEEDSYRRGTIQALLGLGEWASGNLENALKVFMDGVGDIVKSRSIYDRITAVFVFAEMNCGMGRLNEAERVCLEGLKLAKDHGRPWPPGTEDIYSALSEVHREKGEFESAAENLRLCREIGETLKLPDWRYRWCLAQAQLDADLGRFDHAMDRLAEAERVYVRTPLPEIRPASALRSRICLRQGNLEAARAWARACNLPDSEIGVYIREFEFLTLVRVLISEHREGAGTAALEKAMNLLLKLLDHARSSKRDGSILEILILLAIVHHSLGKPEAVTIMTEAVELASPEGYLRIFVNEGPDLWKLVSMTADRTGAPSYTNIIRKALYTEIRPATAAVRLSRRELEVLRSIAAGLSNEEIGDALFVSISTVKGHNQRIFEKLGVKRRTEAVAAAQEMGLL